MKIAFLVDYFPNLSETFILNQITGLIDRGHEVDVYKARPRLSRLRNFTLRWWADDENERLMHEDIRDYDLFERAYQPPCFLPIQ